MPQQNASPIPTPQPTQTTPNPLPQSQSSTQLSSTANERSVATILKSEIFSEQMPLILSYLSLVELMYVSTVNHRWRDLVSFTRAQYIQNLHLGQFWSRIGVLPIQYFINHVQMFHSVISVNLAYCHFLTNEYLLALIEAIPNHAQIKSLNLFYAYQLTDDCIEQLCQKLPHLNYLNLGRCLGLTDKAMRYVSLLPELETLILTYNPSISEELLMLLDDRASKFVSLKTLNVTNCSKLKDADMEEVKTTRTDLVTIGPTPQYTVDKTGKRIRKDTKDN